MRCIDAVRHSILTWVAVLLGAAASMAHARPCETITLRSGHSNVNDGPGDPGQSDLFVRRHDTTIANGSPLSSTSFNAASWFIPAQTGPRAIVIAAYPGWIPSLPSDDRARWINWQQKTPNGGSEGSVLYAIPFTVNSTVVNNAFLNICYAVDNRLGDRPNTPGEPNTTGIYINGVATSPVISGGDFNPEVCAHADIINISDLVTPGENWMYIYQRDLGRVSGLIFSATIQINSAIASLANTPTLFPVGQHVIADGSASINQTQFYVWCICQTEYFDGPCIPGSDICLSPADYLSPTWDWGTRATGTYKLTLITYCGGETSTAMKHIRVIGTNVPTVSEWGLIVLGIGILLVGAFVIRGRVGVA